MRRIDDDLVEHHQADASVQQDNARSLSKQHDTTSQHNDRRSTAFNKLPENSHAGIVDQRLARVEQEVSSDHQTTEDSSQTQGFRAVFAPLTDHSPGRHQKQTDGQKLQQAPQRVPPDRGRLS